MKLSVQLYTVRELAAKDFAATAHEVAKIGYRAVEFGGNYGNLKSASDARKALDDAGLVVSGIHGGIDALEKDLGRILDDNHTLGNTNIICPWMPVERRKSADAWRANAESLNRIGAACRSKGFTFSYHNHSFEFQQFDGKTAFDILLENADPDSVRIELDVYWVKHGGHDPISLINKLGRRIHLLHLKDMAPGADQRFAPVGAGILDFKTILEAGRKLEVPWGVVEQDDCYGQPPIEALRISFENLRKLRLS